uniref:Cytochrome oxidase complex assembly protein 1 n=1 Tax=Rhabditophanes sp. KR3021 TaxID=114890 RepID=A0AC35U902_9BILA
MLKKIQTSTLVIIAGGGLVFGTGLIYVAQTNVQKKVRNLSHYQECFKLISKHEKVISLLGQPIQVGQVDLADRKNNFIGIEESRLRIPVTGTHNSGFLNVHASRIDIANKDDTSKSNAVGINAAKGSEFITNTIELELEDAVVTIYAKKP